MEFKKYIAIDWSGANNRRPTDAIQIAEYVPQTQHVSIVRSCTQSPTGWNIWSREAVLHYVQREIKKGKVLIGFDFAFGYPYCDKDAYFPELDASPGNAPNLWKQWIHSAEQTPISTAGNSIGAAVHVSNAITNITDSKVTGTHPACALLIDGLDALLELIPFPSSAATGRKMWALAPSLE